MSVFCSLEEDGTPLAIYEEYTKDSCGIKFSLQTSRSHDNSKTVSLPCAEAKKSTK